MTLLQLANELSDYMDPSLDPYARECIAYDYLWTACGLTIHEGVPREQTRQWLAMWSKPLSDSNPTYKD